MYKDKMSGLLAPETYQCLKPNQQTIWRIRLEKSSNNEKCIEIRLNVGNWEMTQSAAQKSNVNVNDKHLSSNYDLQKPQILFRHYYVIIFMR